MRVRRKEEQSHWLDDFLLTVSAEVTPLTTEIFPIHFAPQRPLVDFNDLLTPFLFWNNHSVSASDHVFLLPAGFLIFKFLETYKQKKIW